MLDNEEIDKIEKYLTDCTVHMEQGYQYSSIFNPTEVYWLAEKLKKVNDELKEIKQELKDASDNFREIVTGYVQDEVEIKRNCKNQEKCMEW